MYEYNPKSIVRHIKNKSFSQRSLSESTNTSRPTVIRWVHGEDIYVSKLLKICNEFRIPLGDFILENGLPVSPLYTDDKNHTEALKNLPPENSINVSEVMKYEDQIRKIKEEYEDKIVRMEKEFLERIGDIRESSAEKWAKKNLEAVQAERLSIESKYEQRLKEQNDEIIRLREEVAILKSRINRCYPDNYINTETLSEQERGAHGK